MPAKVPSILHLPSGRLLIHVLFPSPRNRVRQVSMLFCVSLTATHRTGIEQAARFLPSKGGLAMRAFKVEVSLLTVIIRVGL